MVNDDTPEPSPSNSDQLMWVEKYRPMRLSEVINQSEIVKRLEALVKRPADIPHLLFAGPPGTGKTTTALCVAREIMKEHWKDYTLELNASNERGIDTVRTRIKNFASYSDRREGIPFRLVILDESDAMTNDAQTALRRIMEESHNAARFVLTANYSSNIIEPLQSRCAVFRFSRLSETDVVDHLESVCKKESVKCVRSALSIIYKATEGDMRHAINMLQAASTLGEIDNDSVNRVTGLSGSAKVEEVINTALAGDFSTARIKMLELLKVGGLSEHDFIKFSNDALSRSKEFASSPEAIEATAEADYRLLVGANPDIQLSAYLARLASIGKHHEKTK
ncbi:MAG: replication factor C small subunit [Nitrososphaerales archaeon]